MKSIYICLGLAVLLCTSQLRAQEVISSAGGHATATGISLSWTVGEPVVSTVSNGTVTLTQGFHQSRLSATATDDLLIPGLELTVYPNPSSTLLNLRVDGESNTLLRYTLFSSEGKALASEKIAGTVTSIDMQGFANGNYLLQVGRKSGKPIKTFKVIKQ